MEKTVRILSPVKLNLHLEVCGKRSDGFHDIVSIFHMANFGDELFVSSLKETDACRISGDFSIEPSENSIWKAATVFRERTGIRSGISFSVVKTVPTGSGTGGGSSNAASALRALNVMFETGFSNEELAEMGSVIGSDVPFFCLAPAALVRGRGESIMPIDPRSSLYGTLLYPDFGIATSLAYGWIDSGRENNRRTDPEYVSIDPLELIRRYERLKPEEWKFFNSFFPFAAARYPDLARFRDRLYELGASYAQMSGSGSAIFGLFTRETAAHSALEGISGRFRKSTVFKLLDRLPDTVLQ